MEIIDLKKQIKFSPDRISREMLSDKPEMRVALMCLKAGQKLEPHKAPLRLMMYCVQGKGTFTVGEEKIEADKRQPSSAILPYLMDRGGQGVGLGCYGGSDARKSSEQAGTSRFFDLLSSGAVPNCLSKKAPGSDPRVFLFFSFCRILGLLISASNLFPQPHFPGLSEMVLHLQSALHPQNILPLRSTFLTGFPHPHLPE